jgi:D-inositol-3-phosphate glycosyltransferase
VRTTLAILAPEDLARELNAPSHGHTVFGGTVAAQDFCMQLVRHGSSRVNLFARPFDLEAVKSLLSVALPMLKLLGRLKVRSITELNADQDEPPCTAWHDPFQDSAPFAIRNACASRRYPITHTPHCFSNLRHLRGYFLPVLLSGTREYDSIVATSSASRNAMAQLLAATREWLQADFGIDVGYRGRIDVLPLGIDTAAFCPRDKRQVRRQLGLAEQGFLILSFGRLAATDKADLLPFFPVLRQLVDRYPAARVTWLVAGTGYSWDTYVTTLREAATDFGLQEHCLFWDDVNNNSEKRVLVYSAADVFFAPSDNVQETFGLTPIEALAAGLPQLVSDWDGYRDSVRHGETGFLLPTTFTDCLGDLERDIGHLGSEFIHLALGQSATVDMRACHEFLCRLIEQEPLRAQMAQASRQRAVQIYDWSRVIPRYEELWSELAQMASASKEPARTSRYYNYPYFRVFRDYATQNLQLDAAAFKVTASAREVAARSWRPRYARSELLFDAKLLRRIVQQGEFTYQQLLAWRDRQGTEDWPHYLGRHVLWLLKHGYLERVR